MAKFKWIAYSVVVLVVPLLAGCTARPSAPVAPWSASMSDGGGVTGAGGRATIHSDGTVTKELWDRAGMDPVVSDAGVVPDDKLAVLQKALLDSKLKALPTGEPANMTTTLTFQSEGAKQTWMWEQGSSSIAAPLTRVDSAFRAALSVTVNSAVK